MEVEPRPTTDHFSSFEIDLYIDGELPHDSLFRFETHLPSCHVCRETLRDRQTLHLAINNSFIDPVFIPTGFAQNTAGIASNVLSFFGKRPVPRNDILIVWFIAIAFAALVRVLPATTETALAKMSFLPGKLTVASVSVSFLFSGLEIFSTVLLRYFFH